jgi:hypothetical protein
VLRRPAVPAAATEQPSEHGHCRSIGLAKARLQHVATAAAINVYRISDWLEGVPRAATRTSRFARLAGRSEFADKIK